MSAAAEQTVLITGLTSRTGRFLLERMQQQRSLLAGMRFRAVVRPSSDTAAIDRSGLPIEKVTGDVTDPAFMAQAAQGADVLLHIMGIHWSEAVVSAALRAGARRVIAVHTTGIYSKYKSAGEEYRAIDEAVAHMCKEAGASLTVLRPTMIYGGIDDCNVCTFIRMVDRLPVMPVVSGARYPLQPVHRKDLGYAYFDVLTQPEKTDGRQYVLSGEKPILLREMLGEIGKCLGRRVRFVSVPYWIAISGAVCLYAVSLGRIDYREKVQRLVEPRAYPHEDAARDFGYAPMPFSVGIAQEVSDYREANREK